MSKIVIGEANGKNVSLDIDLLLSTRLLLTADSGGGKTFALKRIVEQAFGKIQILILDPEGEFSPLREKLDFVLVGKGGETPADVRSAALVATTLLKLRACAIVDLYEMKPSDRHAYVKTFIEAMIEAPKELRHPCLVIVDEAHIFCPEHGKGESIAGEAMISLCTRGRKRLLCPLFATQRLATLSKDASSMLLNRMIGPTFEDINRKRAADVLGIAKDGQKEFYKHIQVLEPGNFFCLGRAISKEMVLVHVGPIQTPHGREAIKYEMTPPPAPDKIKALLPSLADLPKEAEEKARTVAELTKQLRAAQQELKQRPTVETPKVEEKIVEVPTVTDKQIAALHNCVEKLGGIEAALAMYATAITDGLAKAERKPLPRVVQHVPHVPHVTSRHQLATPVQNRTAIAGSNGNSELSGPQRALLQRLSEFRSIGREAVKLAWLAASLGTTVRSRGFEENMRTVRKANYVATAGAEAVTLTADGLRVAGEADVITGTQLRSRVHEMLSGPQSLYLSHLEAVYPQSLALEEIAATFDTTVRARGFEENTRFLRSNDLIIIQQGQAKASDWLFID